MLFHKILILCLIVMPAFLHGSELLSPDLQRENMIYQQNLSEIFEGEQKFVEYKYGKYSILEIFDDENDSAVLYLHGRGLNPNEQNLANPMRIEMSDVYNTYSIQLPVLKKNSTYYEYVNIFYDSDERIKSAIRYILKNNRKLTIIAHSCGVHMLMSYIRNYNLSPEVEALVLIGSGAVDKGQKLLYQYPYNKISVPILDLFGENDFHLVLQESRSRKELIKGTSKKSRQIEIKSSNHYHDDNSQEVIEIVKKWLSHR